MPPHSLLPHRPGMNNFTAALASIRRVKSEGVVKDYAIGGAMALAFWSEPIPTFDLDVFGLLVSLLHKLRIGPGCGGRSVGYWVLAVRAGY